MNKVYSTLILLLCQITTLSGTSYYVATNGSNSNNGTSAAPFSSFSKAFATMTAGDTLIIKDGTYTERMVDIPSGAANNYIHIRAEHNFKVKIHVGSPLLISNKSYIRIEGIKYDGMLAVSDCAMIASSHHIKIIRCSFTGSLASATNWNIVTFGITAGCNYILVEECWAWGTGRYKFLAYTSDNVIFRRCVARHDYHPTSQCACFHRYSSINVDFQNCIALDCGVPDESNGKFYGGIYNDNHDPAKENTGKNLGCILLNLGDGCPIYDIRIWGTRTIEHCVVWDCVNGIDLSNYNDGITPFSPAKAYVNHCTVGNLWGTGWAGGYGIFDEMATMEITSVENSIITRASDALNEITESDYNCFYRDSTNYANTPSGSHDNTNNPALLYITRTTTAAGNASDGGYRGATVEKRYGSDESFWGDSGYEVLTNVNLWPWPNEDEIKADMSSWNENLTEGEYTSAKVSGTRGFCANKIGLNGLPLTLTSYIWEYSGYPCPPEIYGTTSVKRVVPSSGKPLMTCSPHHTISFELFRKGAVVKLSIYRADGRRVATKTINSLAPGKHTISWDVLHSGLYLLELQNGSQIQQQRVMVTR